MEMVNLEVIKATDYERNIKVFHQVKGYFIYLKIFFYFKIAKWLQMLYINALGPVLLFLPFKGNIFSL